MDQNCNDRNKLNNQRNIPKKTENPYIVSSFEKKNIAFLLHSKNTEEILFNMQSPHNMIMVLFCTATLLSTCLTLPTKTRYCGSNLADALKLACGSSGYNVPSWATEYELVEGAKQKHALIRSLGVATECCYFGCSWRTLTSYCADPRAKKSKKSSGDEDQYDNFEKLGAPLVPSDEGNIKESELAAIAPEVGDMHHKPGRMGKRGRKGHKRRKGQKGRKGRKREQRRRGGRVPRCRCETRKKRPKKMELENIQRSAPVFGTVSPEYLRLPRTLDEMPPPYHGMQGY